MAEVLTMTSGELDRLRVIRKVLEEKLRWKQAGSQLGLSVRQIGRLCAQVRHKGNRGVIHGLRGKSSNHRTDSGILERALKLVKQHYADFGPTFANEKLLQRHGVVLSTSRLRKAMIQEGLWRARRVKTQHRAWRPRRSCVGELIQLDGSEHDWFEHRAPRCVFLLYIDDATSRLMHGEFVESEALWSLFGSTKYYLEHYGRPIAFYVDKDSIYKISRQPTIEEQLRDVLPLTQFTRAMTELDIAVITANSPQAKGRVERSFDTHQDRLVKELRLAGISTLLEANRFLREVYLPGHNARFAVEPENSADAHRPLLVGHDLETILSQRTPRILANDFTLRFRNRYFQLMEDPPVRLRPGQSIEVEKRLDGSIHLRCKGRYLAFRSIAKKPARSSLLIVAASSRTRPPHPNYHPPQTHPDKKASYEAMLRRKASVNGGYPQVSSFPPFPRTPIRTTTKLQT